MIGPNTIAQSENEAEKWESFFLRLTGGKQSVVDFSELWNISRNTSLGMIILGKQWKGLKDKTGKLNEAVMRRDLRFLLRRSGCSISNDEDPIEWGIRTTKDALDFLPNHLSYLKDTCFYDVLEQINKILDDSIKSDRHRRIIELFKQFNRSRDFITTSQFYSNEMVGYYKYLERTKIRSNRQSILKHIRIYQDLCGVYEKDILICYCLLQIRMGNKVVYEEIKKDGMEFQERINFIKSKPYLNTTVKPYNRIIRNARVHYDFEIDPSNKSVRFYEVKSELCKQYSFDEVIALTKDMSAVASALRLIPIAWSYNDWNNVNELIRQYQ